ncbi:MAG: transporter substrate-binding domain-containing protein [Porticoccus sp.]|nr:transporter substrate-binding domain-containing protein [Porticoccus sp.]
MFPDFTTGMLRVYSCRLIKLFFLLVLILLSSELLAVDGNSIELTDDERSWVAEHPAVVVGNFASWAPFDYSENGEPQGYTVDLVRMLGSRTGLELEFITEFNWLELMEKFKAGQIDIMPSIYLTEERQAFMSFTQRYLISPLVIVTHSDNADISDLSDLSGKRVVSIAGYANTLALQNNYPDIEVILIANTLDGLKAVSQGTADAFIEGVGVVSYTLKKHSIPNVKVVGDAIFKENFNSDLYMGVAKNNITLRNILDKGLASLSRAEKHTLHQRWLSVDAFKDQDKIKLTEAEQKWLDAHPVIRLAPDISWPPVEWVDEGGQYSGLASDYIRLIEGKLGIQFEVEKNKPWVQVVQAVKARELDVFPSITRTQSREKYANFTRPYLSFPTVIVARDSINFIDGAEGLRGLKVAVVDGYVSHEFLQQNHPELELYPQVTIQEALTAISKGEYDAFVGNIATVGYTIREEGLVNIKIAGEIVHRFDLSMGVRKDWPELVGILQKAIDSIDGQQHAEIYDRWIGLHHEYVVDHTLLWKILAAVLIVVSLMYYTNRKLSGEVNRRKKIEEELLDANEVLHEARRVAEHASRAQSRFLSSMSHELRTPLNAVIGFSQILEMNAEGLGEENRESVKHIHEAGVHLLALIDEVLDLASINAGKLKLSVSAIKLEQVFEECCALAAPLGLSKDVSIKRSGACNLVVYADAVRLRQAVLNYLSNAIKYNRTGGNVWISCQAVSSDRVRINVKDTGFGLTREQAAQLFQPFERIGAETRNIEGTGIGLTITKELIELMGGSVGVDSDPGKGSTFWLELDGVPSDESPLSDEDSSDGDNSGGAI